MLEQLATMSENYLFMATDYKKDPSYTKNLEYIVKAIHMQIMLTPKASKKILKGIKGTILFSKSNLDMLAKDDFIYGYLYGFVDISFQMSEKYKDDKEAWLGAAIIIFREFYGDKLAAEIISNSKTFLDTNEKFKKGCQLGMEEAEIYYQSGKPVFATEMGVPKITGLGKYNHKIK